MTLTEALVIYGQSQDEYIARLEQRLREVLDEKQILEVAVQKAADMVAQAELQRNVAQFQNEQLQEENETLNRNLETLLRTTLDEAA